MELNAFCLRRGRRGLGAQHERSEELHYAVMDITVSGMSHIPITFAAGG